MIGVSVLLVSSFYYIEGAKKQLPEGRYISSGDMYFVSSGDHNHQNKPPCCTTGNHSISDVLNYISSDNVIVNITSDDMLSSNITLVGLENVTIIGHRNPVVNCNNIGAIKFISCKNIIIEGIQWENCGSIIYPGITFYNSSNILFESCSFSNSEGRSVLLSEVLGYVYINNCNFTHKVEYKGHGAAIHYSTGTDRHSRHKLMIMKTKFISNRATKSVVYIDGSGSRIRDRVYLQDNVFVNNTGVPVYISHNSLYIRGSVLFKGNVAKSGGGIYSNASNIIFMKNSNADFSNNSATLDGGAIYQINSRIFYKINSIVTFKDNGAKRYGGAVYAVNSNLTLDSDSSTTFNNNEAGWDGGALYSSFSSHITIDGDSIVKFYNNKAYRNGGALSCYDSSLTTFNGNSVVTFNNNKAQFNGGALLCQASSFITFDGNSSVMFNSNKATKHSGGAVFCRFSSRITFNGSTSVTFNNNEAIQHSGGAVFCQSSSHIKFSGKSNVKFDNNKAGDHGGAVLCHFSSMTFDGNSTVIMNNNKADDHGGAILCQFSSNITFGGISSVMINNNEARDHGGAVLCQFSSHITFDDNSSVAFIYNEASRYSGGAVFCQSSSYITFDGNSSVTFDNNKAGGHGGGVFSQYSSHITFSGDSIVTFSNNKAHDDGGAVFISTHITFNEYSTVTFTNNSAVSGGALLSHDKSYVSSNGNTLVYFICNKAIQGGAIYSKRLSYIIFEENSTISFYDNKAVLNGGAIRSSNVTFTAYSTVLFYNNLARQDGSAIYSVSNAQILFSENCLVIMHNNTAFQQGGAVYLFDNATLTFKGHSNVAFLNNVAMQYGGAIYSERQATVLLEGHSTVSFKCNKASQSGGALSITDHSTATFTGESKVIYYDNKVTQYGGAIYCSRTSNITLNGNVSAQFINNTSEYGGALSILQSFMEFEGNSSVVFTNNTADQGGAIYCDLTKSSKRKIAFNTTDIAFYKNIDLMSSDVYLDIPTSCDETCLNDCIVGVNKGYALFGGIVKTSPRKLKLNDTAVCIDNNNSTNCQMYLVNNIMLGQEVIINACVLDYYNQPAGTKQFVLSNNNQGHHIVGSSNVLLSCTAFKGVSVIGKRILHATNYSINITSYDSSQSDSKKFSVELITELSPCHPGFHYNNTTQTCVCYSDSDVVSCSGSTSSIKRGYWFGEVNEKATVTICPNSYCNFTCCEAASGYYKLSPVRANQCNSLRSGTACGSCKEGYTLSFDSVECVSFLKCTTGQTILVVMLSILYWIVIVALVFIVTYYHIGIGYLYAITYYYSVVDILLREHLYISQGLFTFVSIMSSIAKVTPQFLGRLCLVTYMSGIDQQFIHYVHPLAVAIIIAIICLSARISYKFSSFVSRGIIRVICFLLLLSYTSVATTSLLLLRSLTFHEVDKVYTYLSPDIEYLHGRHLPYCVLAMLCSLIIVIGLPLLILIEPFVNHKINFTRIKPLLDQFKGCYKDKYRSFAAYYMTCRLVIILIIISNPSNDNSSQYLLIISNSILALIHVTLRPYEAYILNLFDGFVLQLMIVVSMVPLIDYNSNVLLAFIFVLVILPLLAFLLMEISLYKNAIKKIAKCCLSYKPDDFTSDNKEKPIRSFVDSVIDDTRRVNATICEM